MTSTVVEYFHDNGRLQYHAFSLNGEFHKTDGPAREWWDDNGRLVGCAFYVNGKLHRTDGPACELWNTEGLRNCYKFWINGEKLTEEDFHAWQLRQRQRELAALVFALEHKFPAEAPEREFLRHILPAHVAANNPL